MELLQVIQENLKRMYLQEKEECLKNLGIEEKLDYLHKFEYHVPYKDIGSENEICGTLDWNC